MIFPRLVHMPAHTNAHIISHYRRRSLIGCWTCYAAAHLCSAIEVEKEKPEAQPSRVSTSTGTHCQVFGKGRGCLGTYLYIYLYIRTHTHIYIYTNIHILIIYIYACTRMLYIVPLYMFEMYLLYTGIYVWIDTYCSRRTLIIDRHRGFIVELVMCMFKSFIYCRSTILMHPSLNEFLNFSLHIRLGWASSWVIKIPLQKE